MNFFFEIRDREIRNGDLTVDWQISLVSSVLTDFNLSLV